MEFDPNQVSGLKISSSQRHAAGHKMSPPLACCLLALWLAPAARGSAPGTGRQKNFSLQLGTSDHPPVLPAGGCAELPAVNNSIFMVERVAGKTQGTLICANGYHLVGRQTLICNTSQGWSGPAPTCQAHQGTEFLLPQSGENSTSAECRVRRLGWMSQARASRPGPGGWGSAPWVGHCPDPVLVNGQFSATGPVHVDDTVTFRCHEDHILQGSRWSRCLQNRTWAPPVPICKSRHCGHPGNPPHGYFKGDDFNAGSVITYFCEARYQLVGAQSQRCVDGEWSGHLPACKRIPERPKSAVQDALDKALLAFWESREPCHALGNFTQRLKRSGFRLKDIKFSLEMKKAELEGKTCLASALDRPDGRNTFVNKGSSWP
ncbi:C4b-binding protein beta chain isoform X2 [Erinaceus europaeus]|uniref:C4b-binding protein beta chain isoform X2 n=1 Tax=Erinaceus europaeus TaxID=9365 RepID=A0ABM3WCI7_ERIEU|nr:C4b-binding protein beta chain isoform X2 [Erinaceus europaeus]